MLFEVADLLRGALLGEGELGLLEAADVVAGAIGDDDVDDDEVGAGLDGGDGAGGRGLTEGGGG